jgi:outer membrane protein assembly factor BamD (BamD/ComL family)
MKVSDMRNAYMALKTLTFDYPESKWAKFARGQLVQNTQAFDQFQEM